MIVAESLAKEVNVKQACNALALPRSGFYRWKGQDGTQEKEKSLPVSPLALSVEEQNVVLPKTGQRFLGSKEVNHQ